MMQKIPRKTGGLRWENHRNQRCDGGSDPDSGSSEWDNQFCITIWYMIDVWISLNMIAIYIYYIDMVPLIWYIYIYSIWINLFDVHQNISTCTFCMKQTFPICHSPFVAGILKNGLQHISTILQHISTAWVSPLTGLPEGGGNWTTGGSDSVKNPNRFSMIHV